MIRVPVPLGEHGYEVIVGAGAVAEIAELLPSHARRAAVVTQATVPFEVPLPLDSTTFLIGEGEQAKSLATVEELCRVFARAGIGRGSVVVAVGGGVVTDVAGFVAATYHRGLPVVHVPTTLLGQVDAAIGGKTGVNLPEGKNLVGAFWQPAGVCCDTASLATLPDAEWRSGLGEMVKYAFLGIDDLAGLPLDEQVARCVALKAGVVASDERDGGRRMILNYGHTLAHALEASTWEGDAAALRHGEAVAIGLVFAARLAQRLGRIDGDRVEHHRRLVAGQGLPTELPAPLCAEGARAERALAELVSLMRRDKKAAAGLTFVLDGPAGVEVVEAVPEEEVAGELALMAAESRPGVPAETAATLAPTAPRSDEGGTQ